MRQAINSALFSLSYFALVFAVILLIGVSPWVTGNRMASKLYPEMALLECRPEHWLSLQPSQAGYPGEFSLTAQNR